MAAMGSSVAVLLACLVLTVSHGGVGAAALRPAWLAKVKVGFTWLAIRISCVTYLGPANCCH